MKRIPANGQKINYISILGNSILCKHRTVAFRLFESLGGNLRMAFLPAPTHYIYGRDSVAFFFPSERKTNVLPLWKAVIPHHDIPIGATQLRVHRKGERWERRRGRIQRPERVAAVGVQRSRSADKAYTGHRNRTSVAFSPLVKIKVLPLWKAVIPHHDIPIGATQLRVHRKGFGCICSHREQINVRLRQAVGGNSPPDCCI